MRPPATVQPWLSTEELQVWVREAPDKESYQRRLAVWLTEIGPFPAHQIAEWLCVSKQAIWLWVGQYNHQGPEGLDRQGRGGRRWAYLSLEEEETFLRRFQRQATEGKLLTAKQLHAQLVERTGRKLTVGYVYGLLHRQGWRKLGPRPRHPRADPEAQERFKKNSPDSWKPR